jgi:hypothetical protein
VITYTYINGNGCSNSCEFILTVNPLPGFVYPQDIEICENGGIIEFNPEYNEQYIFEGEVITSFDPAEYGEGIYIITYVVTNEFGCTNGADFTITVFPAPVAIVEDVEVCENGGIIEFNPEFNEQYIFESEEVDSFDPAVYGEGIYTITYIITNEFGCSDSKDFTITVYPAPVAVCEDREVCEDGDIIEFNPQPLEEYTLDGVVIISFDPQEYGPGVFEILFTVTTEFGCVDYCTFTITVYALPIVICPEDFAVCLDTESFILSGANPEGGIYSGTGVTDGMFDPAEAGLGVFEITYTYTDDNGCENYCTFNILVSPVAVSYAGEDAAIVAGDYYELSQATATNYTSLLWTGGDGIFYDATALNPIYIPGEEDITNGFANLCLTAFAEDGCYDVTDCLTLTINLWPRITVSPTSLKRLLKTGETTTAAFTINNPGYADLDFDIAIDFIDGSGWLSVGTSSGTIPLLSSGVIDVTFDATGLADGVYTANINITSNAPETPLVTIPATLYVGEDVGQLVQLRAGWSGISSYMILDDPALEDIFTEQVASNSIEILLDTDGIFWPGQNVNQIGNWNTHKGYKVKMNFDDAVIFSGQFVDNKTVLLPEGISYMPVLSKVPVPVSEIFNQVEDDLLYAFDIYNGLVYWPEGGIFTLQVLEPGVGYLITMVNPGAVTFPESDGWNNLVEPLPQIVNNAPWTVDNTGNTHIVSIYSSAFEGLNIGDIVAVFNNEEKCVGMVQYNGGNNNLGLVVYGDDFTTELIDGMTENEVMNLVIYSPSTQEFTQTQVNWDISMPNSGTFVNHGLSAITSLKLGSVGIAQLSEPSVNIYPNPAIDKVMVNITGDISDDAQIKVYDTRGSLLIDLPVAGKTTALAVSHLENGMYIVRITNSGMVFTEKLLIQK